MKLTRIALPFSILSLLSFAVTFSAFAAAPAYVDNQVRDRVEQGEQARVLIQMGDASHPEIWASAWRQRTAAIHTLTSRVLAAAPSLRVQRSFEVFPFLAATVDKATLQQVIQRPEVEAVFPDRAMKGLLNYSGPLVGQPQAEAAGYTGAGVGVAIVDTGIDYKHPAFNTATAKFFTDVTPGFWAWTQTEALAEHGLVAGYPDGSYHPGDPVTRDQMAVYIARALSGGDAEVPTGPGTASFPDVPTSYWAFKYIEYAKSAGVVQGYGDGTYQPDGTVTRDQMAVFVARALAGGDANVPTPASGTQSFPDVAPSYWAYKYIEYCKAQGVVNGYPDGTYQPGVTVTRDQMAVFVDRGFKLTWGGRMIGGVNLLLPSTDPGYTNPMDDYGHGTMVVGVVASMDHTYRGMAPGANLIGVKVLDNTGSGYSSDVIAGIQWCIQNQAAYNIKVLNLSLGDGTEWTSHEACDQQPEGQAIQDAVNAGIFVSVASGNESYTKGLSLPACASAAVSVGATQDGEPDPVTHVATQPDAIATYSDRGELMTMFAPGTFITAPQASIVGGGFATEEGTSFSSPHVAGAAADLIQMGITDPLAIRQRLVQTGVRIIDPATNVASPRLDLVTAINPPANGPDLVVTSVSSTVSSAFVGDTINLSLTVMNQGNAASPACRALVLLSANSVISPQDYALASVNIPALGAGRSYSTTSLTGTVPAVIGGSYYLGGFVDCDYVVTETNEFNNSYAGSTSFTVLVPSAHVVSTTIPASMKAGHAYSVSVTMLNDGTTTWTPGTYTLGAVSPEGTNRWGTSSAALSTSVAPGATKTITFSVTAPSTAGAYACHWRMMKGGTYFGEVATGATVSQMLDDATLGQDYPSASGNLVAFMDYKSGKYSSQGVPAVSVKNVPTGTLTVLPDSMSVLPSLINSGSYIDVSNNWFPSINGNWVAWMSDNQPSNPSNPGDPNAVWYFQVVAYNVSTGTFAFVTQQNADAWYPSVSGNYVVWEDYRNDSDGMPDQNDFLNDNADIYIADLSTVNATTHQPKVYPICTASGPQLAPHISGNYVVWEDWRDGLEGHVYCYDLSVDTGNTGTPNWKRAVRPNPDPAERRLTTDTWYDGYPDVSGNTAVWLDYQNYNGPGGPVSIMSLDLSNPSAKPVPLVTDPPAYRQQVRIDGTQYVWEDWRNGKGEVYWSDIANPSATALIGSSPGYDGVPNIGGGRVAYSQYRATTTATPPVDVYNVWSDKMLPYVTVSQ